MQAARREAEEALDSVTMPDPEQEPLLSSGRMSRWAAARAASPLRLRMRKGPLVVLRGKRGGEAGRQRCACVGAERDRTPAEQRRRASSPAALGRPAAVVAAPSAALHVARQQRLLSARAAVLTV